MLMTDARSDSLSSVDPSLHRYHHQLAPTDTYESDDVFVAKRFTNIRPKAKRAKKETKGRRKLPLAAKEHSGRYPTSGESWSTFNEYTD